MKINVFGHFNLQNKEITQEYHIFMNDDLLNNSRDSFIHCRFRYGS